MPTDDRLDGRLYRVGNGTSDPIVINTGAPTRIIEPHIWDIPTGQKVHGTNIVVTGPGIVELRPDQVVSLNRWRVFCDIRLGFDDVDPPAVPVLTVLSKGIDFVTVQATATDASALDRWGWWLDGVLIGITPGTTNTFTFTGLDPFVEYDFGANVADIYDNVQTTLGVVTATTDPITSVLLDSVATGISTHGFTAWSHTVAAHGGRALLAFQVYTAPGGNWTNFVTGTHTVTSDLDGALPFLGGVNLGPSGQWSGALLAFGKLGATVGDHTLTPAAVSDPAVAIKPISTSLSYYGVDQGVALAAQLFPTYSIGTLNMAVTGGETGDVLVGAGGFNATAPAPASLGQTARWVGGASNTGFGDGMAVADAAGDGTTKNFTSTTSAHRGGVAVRLKKAA